jgi:type VI protein secretion system component VasK
VDGLRQLARNNRKQEELESEDASAWNAKSEGRGGRRSRPLQGRAVPENSSLYRGRSERWRNDLPWYLLIGPQGAGKTSLLDFRAGIPDQQDRPQAARDPSSGDFCDWYFAEQAVLVDTAGRFLNQSDSEIDGSAWRVLLDQLRLRRRNRPLNGVVVTVPLDTLLGGEAAVNDLAQKVRSRLQELRQRLHVEVPVYLVLSKTDRLQGFDAFFDQQSREKRASVRHHLRQGPERRRHRAAGQGIPGPAATPGRPGHPAHAPRAQPSAARILDFRTSWGASATSCACSSTRPSLATATSAPANCAAST